MLLADMRAARDKGAARLARLRPAGEDGGLPRAGSGFGPLLDDAVALCSAASMAIAFVAVRRASGVTRLMGGDVSVNSAEGVADLQVKCQQND